MSKKTGKLNKVEKFYIENNEDKEVDEIAKDLNRTEASVKRHIEKSRMGHVDEVQDKKSDISELFGHKEDRGVTIMTPAASEIADETRSKRINVSSKHKNAIHIIKKK
jgi:predicted transcriptional regulator